MENAYMLSPEFLHVVGYANTMMYDQDCIFVLWISYLEIKMSCKFDYPFCWSTCLSIVSMLN